MSSLRIGDALTIPGIVVGDVITFSRRPKWWQRALRVLGLWREPPLKQFVVTWTASEGFRD